MNLDLNDFAVFDSPLYRRYKRVRNWHSVNKLSKEDFEPWSWFLLCVIAFALLYFLFSYLQGFLPDWLKWIEAIGAIVLIFAGMIAMVGVVGLVSSTVIIAYRSFHSFCHFVLKKTALRRILMRFEKKYLLQEQLVATKIKPALKEKALSIETASFLAEQQDLLRYIEMAQKKTGTLYSVLESDINAANKIVIDRLINNIGADSSIYHSSLKTTTAKKAPSKVKLRPQSSSSTIDVAPSQSSSPSNLKSPSRTRPPSTTTKRKTKPVQPRLTNWKKVNLSRLEIGEQGEELVLQYEQARLKRIGLGHLAEKIEHSSKVVGDGLGYDIKSFDRQGQTIYIEVKTTRGEFWNNLIFTRNELDVMKRIDQQYVLYRVYCLDDEGNGEISMMRGYGEISKHFSFIPQSFVAKRKPHPTKTTSHP